MTSLASTTVMVLDCQATGAGPDKGHLLEIGWAVTSADTWAEAAPAGIRRFWVRLPPGERIPPGVRRITGISEDDMDGAVLPEAVWRQLAEDAERLTGTRGTCPAVIHFARFETPFLQRLHTSDAGADHGTQAPDR